MVGIQYQLAGSTVPFTSYNIFSVNEVQTSIGQVLLSLFYLFEEMEGQKTLLRTRSLCQFTIRLHFHNVVPDNIFSQISFKTIEMKGNFISE